MSKPSVLTNFNFLQALLAILLGNLVYFALLPSLPPYFRHHRFQIDFGTLIDFFFCAAIYIAIRSIRKWL